MKVLWTCNFWFPEVAKELGAPAPVYGGWMQALADDVIASGVKLAVAALYSGNSVRKIETQKAVYYLLPGLVRSRYTYDKNLSRHWKEVLDDFQPECIHVHGTEYTYPLPLVQVAGSIPVVVSIQGLVSVYERFYMAGIDSTTALFNRSLYDNLKLTGILEGRFRFTLRAKYEAQLLRSVGHVIGRTEWDYANTWAINPSLSYHKCNESLRDPFYEQQWSLDNIERYSIFASQASYPIKGMHLLLEAIGILKRDYPQIKLYVAGPNITGVAGWKSRLQRSGYGKYISKLIRKLGLEGTVEFTGPLNAEAMAKRMAQSHLFTLNSSIENSPNSLGEAQVVGAPCIASYVGGVPSMVTDGEDGLLYNYGEPAILALKIKSVFENDELAQKLSANGKARAMQRHDRKKNLQDVLDIYASIVEKPAK